MSDAKKTALGDGQPKVFSRPQGQLHDFPMEYRWEVTRRHPYYLVFWCEARLYHQREMGSGPEQGFLRHAAMLMLGLIGVNGEPVSPGTSFEDLGGCKIDPAFLSGAVQPMTLRAVSVMLINSLPPAERAVLGAILTTSGESEYAIVGDDAARSEQKRQALGRLAQMSSGALDSYPDAPLFYIHLGASLRSIERDLKNVVQRWKQRQGITERRVHTKKLPKYLEVWDLREGWTGDGYDRTREQTFRMIARRLKLEVSTVASRYLSAFKMITGYEFSPDLWRRLIGPLKLSELLGDPTATLSVPVRHHLRSPVRRPVSESVVGRPTDKAHVSGIVEQGSMIPDDMGSVDLRLDLEDLFKQGLSDEEITEKLELDSPDAVAYFRTRLEDFQGI